MGDGTRLVVLIDPLGVAADGPGRRSGQATVPRPEPTTRRTPPSRRAHVRSESSRVIRVSSHYPFERVNPRLVFDREAATGFRLDLPAGATERWAPGRDPDRATGPVRRRGRPAR